MGRRRCCPDRRCVCSIIKRGRTTPDSVIGRAVRRRPVRIEVFADRLAALGRHVTVAVDAQRVQAGRQPGDIARDLHGRIGRVFLREDDRAIDAPVVAGQKRDRRQRFNWN